jgi:uncharacterized membrane protein
MMNHVTDKARLILVLVGMLLLGIGLVFSFVSEGRWTDFLSGVGGGLMGAGALTFIISRVNPAYARELERRKHDERSRQIRGRAAHLTVFIMTFLMAIAVLILLYLEQGAIASVISSVLLTMTSLFILLSTYLSRHS